MKTKLCAALGNRIAKIFALTFCTLVTLRPAFAQTRMVSVFPAIAVSTGTLQLPKGVKLVARVPLEGMPITRMYTQREYGHTYLYVEHGCQPLTTVDVTKKRNPRLVDHEPAKVEPIQYEELSEGGSIEVWPRHVYTGIDNQGARGMFSVLGSSNPNDAGLLQALGQNTSNLVDRDSRLVYFASPSQLLIVQDNRWTLVDHTN